MCKAYDSKKRKALQCNYNWRMSQFLEQVLTFSFKHFALFLYMALAPSGVAGRGGRIPGQSLPPPGGSLIPLKWSSVAPWLKWLCGVNKMQLRRREANEQIILICGRKKIQSCGWGPGAFRAFWCVSLFGLFFFLQAYNVSSPLQKCSEEMLLKQWLKAFLRFTLIPWVLKASWWFPSFWQRASFIIKFYHIKFFN